MPTELRPYDEQDRRAVADISSSIYADIPERVDEWQLESPHRYVALDSNTQRVVGYAWGRKMRAQKYRIDLMVHPQRRKQGVGSRLFECLLEDLRAVNAETAQARAREAWTESLSFLSRRSFVETHRMFKMRLEVGEAHATCLHRLVEEILSRGIVITTLAKERVQDPDCLYRLYEMHCAALPGWPDPDPGGPVEPPTFARFLEEFKTANYIPEGLFIAVQSNEYLGYSGLGFTRQNDQARAAGTAVRANLRGQGIATALKLRTVEYARRRGYKTILTNTASPAMFAINEKVGFRCLSGLAEVRLVRRSQEE
jgi:GNAT superfamily N-acetyltransferase